MRNHYNVHNIEFHYSNELHRHTHDWTKDVPYWSMDDASHPVDGLDPWFGIPMEQTTYRVCLTFGKEMARVLRPSTLLFLNQMFALLPRNQMTSWVLRGQECRRASRFVQGPKLGRNNNVLASNLYDSTDVRNDEIWMDLPPSKAIPADYACKAAVPLASVDDFVVYTMAKLFYRVSQADGSGNYTDPKVLACPTNIIQPAKAIAGTSRDAMEIPLSTGSGTKSRAEARRNFVDNILAQPSKSPLRDALLVGNRSIASTLPNVDATLLVFERILALNSSEAVLRWLKFSRRHVPEAEATAMFLAEGNPYYWC